MACYDYKCAICGRVEEHDVPYEARHHPRACSCQGLMHYQFPLSAARGFQPFAPYYDEALGVDVTGRRQKRQTLAALGLQEAGDKRGGARYEERSPLASCVVPLPPQGVSLSQLQRESDLARKAADELVVGVDGRDKVRVKDLRNPAPPRAKNVDGIITESARKLSEVEA